MRRRYLLVDDNAPLAENLAEILRDGGAEAEVAASSADALELARASRFDAVVTDMRMPVMSGAELVHELRRIDPDVPAIVVTAYTGESDLVAARDQGLLAVLPKPVPIQRLSELLSGARRGGLVVIIEDDLALADNLAEALRVGLDSPVGWCMLSKRLYSEWVTPKQLDGRSPGWKGPVRIRKRAECVEKSLSRGSASRL